MSNFNNPAQAMFDIANFFEMVDRKAGGDGIIWAKATASRGAQVIVELQTQNGKRVKIPPIRPGDPVCLSKFATFEVMRDSPDLTQSANNGLLKLMTHAEANEYFEKKAATLKTSPQALMQKAEANSRNQVFKKKLEVNQVDKAQRIQDTFVSEDDIVNPRIVHLCQQVDPRLKDSDDDTAAVHQRRMPVNEFMSEVLDLEDSITLDDIQYLLAKGFYPSVKKWAQAKQKEIHTQMGGGDPETDALSE